MELVKQLSEKWAGIDYPFLIHPESELRFEKITQQNAVDLSHVYAGDVVALIGDFDPLSILTLLRIIDLNVIVVPLTDDTRHQHEYFFDAAQVDVVIEGDHVYRRQHEQRHPLIDELRQKMHAGLVLFSTGTTGRPKAILHDLTIFLKRFETPRPTLRTLSFLLFDHIGGLNTLFHTLFNKGVVIAPEHRTVESILSVCAKHSIEVLPTTPTFLRLMLMSDSIPDKVPESLKIISYGTERMDQPTLDALCELLPTVDFRQTFGMSELGIVRVKSESRNSLYMRIGGEGVETREVDDVLYIRSDSRMLGYLNADSPFSDDGWYDTKDIVETTGPFYKVVGRTTEVINVAGLKFMASEVERVALSHPEVSLVKVQGRDNPITGQHVEITVQPISNNTLSVAKLKPYLAEHLPTHMRPRKIHIADVQVGHRFKKC